MFTFPFILTLHKSHLTIFLEGISGFFACLNGLTNLIKSTPPKQFEKEKKKNSLKESITCSMVG